MKVYIYALFSLFTFNVGAQKVYYYEGAVSRKGSVQLLSLQLDAGNHFTSGSYSIPELGLYEVPIDSIYRSGDTLNIDFYYRNFHCFVNKDSTEIRGISEKWNPKINLHVKRTAKKPCPYTKEEVSFNNGNTRLSGMLFLPSSKASPEACVILVHGSGAQDRYSPYYISLGYRLAGAGYGVLLYDKRGTGASGGNFHEANFSDLAEDAAAGYRYVQKHKDSTVKIGFLGTSQGGWIAPLAASKVEDCSFVILNVGPAVSVFDQETHRVKYSMLANDHPTEEIDSAIAFTRHYLQCAAEPTMQNWEELQQRTDWVKDQDWAYLVNLPDSIDDLNWWRRNNYDPKEALSNLDCPVLAIFGEEDPLVPPKENINLMKDYLDEAGVPYEVVSIPGATHSMKTFQTFHGTSWNWPTEYWEWSKQPREFMTHILNFLSEDVRSKN